MRLIGTLINADLLRRSVDADTHNMATHVNEPLVDAEPVPRVVINAQWEIVDANRGAELLLGVDPRGTDIRGVFDGAEPAALAAALAAPIAARVTGDRVIGHLAPGGGATRDVFVEPRPEDSRYHALVQAAAVAIVGSDGDGTIVFVNPHAESLFGYHAGELLGLPVETLIPQGLRERHHGHRARYATAPQERPMGAGRVLHAAHKDGTTLAVEISLGIAATPSGPLYQAIIIDVSARESAHAALAQQMSRQAALAELGTLGLSATPQGLMDAAVVTIARCLRADMAAVCELARNESSIRVRSAAGRGTDGLKGIEFAVTADTAAGYVLSRAQPVLDEELVRAGCFEGSPQHLLGMTNGAALRIDRAGARPYGILHVHVVGQRTFGEDELAFLRSVGSVLAVAIDRAHHDALFELSADLLAVAESADGYLVRANASCKRTLGWSEEEMYARPVAALVHPRDRARFLAAYAELSRGNAAVVDFEGSFLTKAGTYRHLLASARADADGRFIYVVAKDITERRERESALAQSAAENELILRSAGAGILRMDTAGTITYVNHTAALLLGWEAETLVGRDAHARMHHTRADGAPYPWDDCPNRAAIASGEDALVLDEVFWRADGTSFPVEYTSAALRDDGRIVGAVVVFSDITGRRHLEAEAELKRAAEQANLAKNQFMSRMSHELRTPLNAILGFGQLLERSPLDEREQRYTGHILAGGRHLLTLIDEVLEIARIESGDLGLSPQPVPVGATVHEALNLIEPIAEGHGVSVEVDLGDQAAAYVLADCQRMKQVLLNLLSNAVKYNRPGGIVGVSAIAEGETLVLAVTDTGIGIASAKLPRLFSPFDRLGAEASGVQGTGLGLALSRRLAEAMHGSITAASEIGVGSTFALRLPLTAPPETTTLRPPSRAEPSATAASHVLYIENDLASLRLIEAVLADDDVRVTPAATGRLGIDIATSMRPDVVLLALHLPDMAGWDVLSELRARPETAAVPVIVVTADATSAQHTRMLDAGAVALLTKPLEVDGLRSALAAARPFRGTGDGAL